MCEICSVLTKKAPNDSNDVGSGFIIVKFEQTLQVVLVFFFVFLMLIFNR